MKLCTISEIKAFRGTMLAAGRRNLVHFILTLALLSIISMLHSSGVIRTVGWNTIHGETIKQSLYDLASSVSPPSSETPEATSESDDDSSSDFPSLEVPNFENGGIMIFYHIYKTGGSTVGALMKSFALEDEKESTFLFRRARLLVSWTTHAEWAMDMAENENKVVMFEFHVQYPATRFPTLVDFTPMLVKWRTEAERRGVPFFAFTVLREPVSHAISYFNFFHVNSEMDQRWNPYRRMAPTRENFIQSYQGNRQCHLLDTDANGVVVSPLTALRPDAAARSRALDPRSQSNNVTVRQRECRYHTVRDALFSTMDWVGTTDSLQNETLPLLSLILANDTDIGKNQSSKKVATNPDPGHPQRPGISRDQLSISTLARINRESKLDRWLYDEARERFSFP